MASETLAKIDRAYDVVRALCEGKRGWLMSIPSRPDHDPDLIIGDALLAAKNEIARLAAELEEARERERALREALMTISMRCCEAVMQTPLLEHQSMHALAGACKQDADAALAALRSGAQGEDELATLVVHMWQLKEQRGPMYTESGDFYVDFHRAYQLATARLTREMEAARRERSAEE